MIAVDHRTDGGDLRGVQVTAGDDKFFLANGNRLADLVGEYSDVYDPIDAHLKITEDGSKEFFSFLTFGLLGEQTTSFTYKLKAGEIKEVKFEDIGIAKEPKVIRFNQTTYCLMKTSKLRLQLV